MNTYTEKHLLRADAMRRVARRSLAEFRESKSNALNRTYHAWCVNRALLSAGEHEFAAYLAAGGIR